MNEISKHNKNELAKKDQWTSVEFTQKYAVHLQNNDTMDLIRMERKITMPTILRADTLRTLMKHEKITEDTIVSILAGMILNTANYLNISNNITEEQAIETAFLLIDKYPNESIEDFVYVFRTAKKGEFGKMYNRLDGQIIFEWMEIHFDRKAQSRERLHQEQKQEGFKNDREVADSRELDKIKIKALKNSLGIPEEHSVSTFDQKNYKKVKDAYFATRTTKNNKQN